MHHDAVNITELEATLDNSVFQLCNVYLPVFFFTNDNIVFKALLRVLLYRYINY